MIGRPFPRPGVVLVGGGPGDPELITVRGMRALQAADVVVTDRLGPRQLLADLRAGVEVIEAGKTPGGLGASQEQINDIIVARARTGRLVVRLKGGDPFVFGRGGEELAACLTAGLAVEVVPGVSSAIAAPALAGVPLTHRGITAAFVVASGHLPPDDPAGSVDWACLGAGDATLVLLMAVENLPAIARALLAGGRPAGTPVLVARDASLPSASSSRHRLDEVAAGEPAGLRPPAVVVIGEVVGLGGPP
jgi:uroporphyrin-III C-methyltransferase/precorrin-2 dehydrogenase/sirohydrochlorin ferrochelatase